MKAIGSYTKILTLGHGGLADLFSGDVLLEEKVDGSQFSMSVDTEGKLHCRSKGAVLHVDAPDKMFAAGVGTAKALASVLQPGWVYRGEYLQKPKHNTLAYDRIPRMHVALFDVEIGVAMFLGPEEKAAEAERIGLECVPAFHRGRVESFAEFKALLDRQSFLGGQKIEGVVVKNYARFGADGKVLMGKHVREEFKELNHKDFRLRNPTQGDILGRLIDRYRTPARWTKAVQHLRDRGELEGSPRDIGKLIKEAQADVFEECGAEIQEMLLAWAKGKIARGVTAGLPEWWKEQLAASQFGEQP